MLWRKETPDPSPSTKSSTEKGGEQQNAGIPNPEMEFTCHPEHPEGFCAATSFFRDKNRMEFHWHQNVSVAQSCELHQTQPGFHLALERIPSWNSWILSSEPGKQLTHNKSRADSESFPPKKTWAPNPALVTWAPSHTPAPSWDIPKGSQALRSPRNWKNSSQPSQWDCPPGNCISSSGFWGKKSKNGWSRTGKDTNIEAHCSGYRTNLNFFLQSWKVQV